MLFRHCMKLSACTRVSFARTTYVKQKYLKKISCYSSLLSTSSNSGNLEARTPDSNVMNAPSINITSPNTTLTVTQEELLEKNMSSMKTDLYQKNRVYMNDLLKVLKKVEDIQFSSKKQSLFLLQCCTELLPDESPSNRLLLADQIWNIVKSHTKFEVDHYNMLLRVYIANGKKIMASSFINNYMAPVKPNIRTYELIIRALAETGDINQATEVIANMKANDLPATENIFNSLIVCQGKAGNTNKIKEILSMMKSLKISPSADTFTAVARALAFNKEEDKLLEQLKKGKNSGIEYSEVHIMEIVKTLATAGCKNAIPKVLNFLPESTLTKPSISPLMQSVSTLLVFQNQPRAALEIYKCLPLPSFGPNDDKGLHGRSLVRDCVKASLPSNMIVSVAEELMKTGRNSIAIQIAAKAALQFGKIPLALDLFTRMKEMGLPIRPHYFWPILISNAKIYGEKGIMSTLKYMVQFDVQPDYETISEFTIPYVSFTSPQNLMRKFTDTGLSVSAVLTPVAEALLKTGQVRAASEICEIFVGKLDAEKIVNSLVKGYSKSKDLKSTIYMLEDVRNKATEKNKDWIGRFLCAFMRNKILQGYVTDLIKVAQALKLTDLRISSSAAEYCTTRLSDKIAPDVRQRFIDALNEITDTKLVDDGQMFSNQLPHPKDMKEGELRAHLEELQAKNMNTRGILRKLLQQYCRTNNLAAAKEILSQCEKEGVFLSAGMKASVFDLQVKLGELELAEATLTDLRKNLHFTLDEYKIINFATLLVSKNQIPRAIEVLKEHAQGRHVKGGESLSSNCWKLLDATATSGAPKEVQEMFKQLTTLGYCAPNNNMLGPLIRVHLRMKNIEDAVKEFNRLAKRYKKTPLKHELLCHVLRELGQGSFEKNFEHDTDNCKLTQMAKNILDLTKKIHGPSDAQLSLVEALAEVGFKKSLRKILLDPNFHVNRDTLLLRCARFVKEKKPLVLYNIAYAIRDRWPTVIDEIYDMILDIYQRDDNCTEALGLFSKMEENDVTPSSKFVRNIYSLLKMNNKNIPAELLALHDKQTKIVKN